MEMYCMREISPISLECGNFELFYSFYQNYRHGVQQINLNLFFFFLAGLYKVISNYKCPNFTAFCFFQKAKIIVQRHYTWQPYKNVMLFRYSALDSVSPVPPFSWGPSWECDHYLVLKTKSKEESWIVVVPSFSGSFKTLVSHSWGKTQNGSISACRQVWVNKSDLMTQRVIPSNKHHKQLTAVNVHFKGHFMVPLIKLGLYHT